MCGRGHRLAGTRAWTGETAAVGGDSALLAASLLRVRLWAPPGPHLLSRGLWPTPCSILADEVCAGRGQRAALLDRLEPGPSLSCSRLCFPLSCLYDQAASPSPGLWALKSVQWRNPRPYPASCVSPEKQRPSSQGFGREIWVRVRASVVQRWTHTSPSLAPEGSGVKTGATTSVCVVTSMHTHSPPVMPGTG